MPPDRRGAWLPELSAAVASATVVVVDDQEANLAVVEYILSAAGVPRVLTLTDPREAVARCLELRPDLLLLDLHMPHMDGFAVMEALREALPAEVFLPILVLTADVTSQARDRALEAGAKDFVTKPFDRTEVLLRVSNLLETRALYDQLEQHNSELRARLDAELAEERRLVARRRETADRVQRVLDEDQIHMVFQPIVDLGSGAVVGVEALARFTAEPLRPPNVWFDEARRSGLAAELELRAVAAAFDQLATLPPDVFIAVNVSPDIVLTDDLEPAFRRTDGRRVVVELTEHTRIDDYAHLLGALDGLRYQGVRVAVDDAGAGYAGLHHILQLLPDVLKMDIELIRGIDSDPVRRALAAALVAFAREIGASIVAEGIETADELATLRALGVSWGQGYHLARPGPLPLTSARIEVEVTPSNGGEG